MKYCVTVVRYGCVFVDTETEAKAIDIVNHLNTDGVNWSDDWEATDCIDDDTACMYITE